jgi:hypothetical protein
MDRRVRSEISFYLGGRRMTELVPSLRGAVHSVVVKGGTATIVLFLYWLLAVFFLPVKHVIPYIRHCFKNRRTNMKVW